MVRAQLLGSIKWDFTVYLAVNFMSKLTGITNLVKHGAGAIKKVAVSVSEAVNVREICLSTEPKTFRNNVVFVLSGCSLCGIRLAIAKSTILELLR